MKRIFFATLLILFSTTAFAQVSFAIANRAFAEGDTVRARVRASSFTNISAFQFSLRSDALRFVSIENGGAIGIDTSSFAWDGKAGYNVADGEVLCGWYDASHGYTFADSTLLFDMVFVATDAGILSTSVEITETLYPCAYTKTLQFRNLDIVFVSEQEALVAAEPQNALPLSVFPNPCYESAVVRVDDATVSVFDDSGRQVMRCAGSGDIRIGGLASGKYVVVAESGMSRWVATLVVATY